MAAERTFLEKQLTEHGSQIGLTSLNGLYRMGCEGKVLGALFLLLGTPSEITLEKSGQIIQMRPLDSKETALGGLDMRQLERIAERARNLLEDIQHLKQTPLVNQLLDDGLIPENDLLAGSPVSELVENYFFGLLHLPEFAKNFGFKPKPDSNRLLHKIFDHIHERTGGWHDALVADVLNDLNPEREEPHTEESLKQWRFRQK